MISDVEPCYLVHKFLGIILFLPSILPMECWETDVYDYIRLLWIVVSNSSLHNCAASALSVGQFPLLIKTVFKVKLLAFAG